jgi:hypothetical protein
MASSFAPRVLAAVAAGLWLTSCGLGPPSGWVVGNGHRRFEQALSWPVSPGAVEVTSGWDTTVLFHAFEESVPLSDLHSLQAARFVRWWIPVAVVPTVAGAHDRVFGVASIQLTSGILWASEGRTANGPGPTLTLPFNVAIPTESSHGATVTLLAPLHVLFLQGSTPEGRKETLAAVVGIGRHFRWSSPRRTRPVSLTAISAMREGDWFAFSPGNGGTSNRGTQTHEADFLHGDLQAVVRITYQVAFNIANPQGVVVYDRGTNWGYLYMEPGQPQ